MNRIEVFNVPGKSEMPVHIVNLNVWIGKKRMKQRMDYQWDIIYPKLHGTRTIARQEKYLFLALLLICKLRGNSNVRLPSTTIIGSACV